MVAAGNQAAAGNEARRLLRSLGWEAPDNAIFHSTVRHALLRESSLAHYNLSEIQLRRIDGADAHAPTHEEFSQVRLLLVTRGRITAHLDPTRSITLTPGRAIIVERNLTLTLDIADDTRFFEYVVREGRLNDNGRLPLRRSHAYTIEHAAAAPFVALAGVNLAGNTEAGNAEHSRASGAHVQKALDHAAAALFADQVSAPGATLTTGEAALIIRAGEALDAHRDDEHFTVQDLARELGISRMYLYRVMVKYGTTPSAFLQQALQR